MSINFPLLNHINLISYFAFYLLILKIVLIFNYLINLTFTIEVQREAGRYRTPG